MAAFSPRRLAAENQRVHEAQSYKDLRADLDRAKGQLGWIPQHRPAASVQSELDGLKTKREWGWSNSCTDIKTKSARDFCQQVHALTSEHASAQQAAALEVRIARGLDELAQDAAARRLGQIHVDREQRFLRQEHWLQEALRCLIPMVLMTLWPYQMS